ncbi:MAG: FecR family protein [Candidatus Cryptobacteroides sp.]
MDEQTIFRAIMGQIQEEDVKNLMDECEAEPEKAAGLFGDVHTIIDVAELEEIGRKMEDCRRNSLLRRCAAIFIKAAGVAATILLAVWITREATVNSFSGMTATVEAPRGEIVHFILPDSTVVYLNSGARLQYPAVFRKDCRNVKLSGEAMFDVSHNDKCPFTVTTFASEIKVLGTRFNVRAEEDKGDFAATLIEGRIMLTNLLDERKTQVDMRPNDIVRINGGRLELSILENPDICWTRGLVEIGGRSFIEQMRDFEKAFDVTITISREELPDISGVSGKVRINDGIDNALKILQQTTSFEFSRNPGANVVVIH